jgi:DNA-binding NarL/FixJ family response regulator
MKIIDQETGLLLLREQKGLSDKDLALAWGLTPREVEVLDRMVEGFSYAKIGGHLDISERTVHAHVQNIFDKMGATTRHVATRMVLERQQ